MKIKTFLNLVEIQTKTASQFPFIFASLFALYHYGSINGFNLALMFLSLLLFDMATTTINNYMDYKKAVNMEDRESHNIIATATIPLGRVRGIIALLLIIASLAGLLLVSRTGPVILILGIFSFLVGIFYTWGPIPISRMPLGEILSGLMMGFFIPYISVYIHHPALAELSFSSGFLNLRIDIPGTLTILLVSLPFILLIANLMLANNICDLEQDIRNDRFLLPFYLGRKASLKLYSASCAGVYLFLILAVVFRVLPLISLLTLLSIPLVLKQMRLFLSRQVKSETFVTAVRNLILFSLSYIAPLGIAVIL